MFKNPSFIFDILCTVVWLVLAVRYARKGFLASVVQLTGSLISLFGARAFSGWAAGQVFERFLAGSFRDQIAANIAADEPWVEVLAELGLSDQEIKALRVGG